MLVLGVERQVLSVEVKPLFLLAVTDDSLDGAVSSQTFPLHEGNVRTILLWDWVEKFEFKLSETLPYPEHKICPRLSCCEGLDGEMEKLYTSPFHDIQPIHSEDGRVDGVGRKDARHGTPQVDVARLFVRGQKRREDRQMLFPGFPLSQKLFFVGVNASDGLSRNDGGTYEI